MAGEKIYIADKETLDKVYNILASDPVYGFIEHNGILSPGSRIEYIGLNKNYSPLARNKENGSMVLNSWADFPVIKANKPYMVRADGTPDYRLKETDYTQREDGGSSDVANSSYNGGAFSWLMRKWSATTGSCAFPLPPATATSRWASLTPAITSWGAYGCPCSTVPF